MNVTKAGLRRSPAACATRPTWPPWVPSPTSRCPSPSCSTRSVPAGDQRVSRSPSRGAPRRTAPRNSGCAKCDLGRRQSYLSDQDIKEAAREWLRSNILASKKKTDTTTPLTVERFHEYVNNELLKEILADPASKRTKIGLETAREWLHLLGFSYCRHRKGMYVDGHERSDVTIDRMEKAVMLKVAMEAAATAALRNVMPRTT